MELVIALSMKLKPFTTGLLTEMGRCSVDAVVQALNAVRLHGHAQLLASHDHVDAKMMDKEVERAKREILAMAIEGEGFDFDIKVVTNDHLLQARRIDIRLHTDKV